MLFSSLPGEMIQFDEHIFQRGWFNHQLVLGCYLFGCYESWSVVIFSTSEVPCDQRMAGGLVRGEGG